MKKIINLKNILLLLLLVFIVGQFFPIDKSQPAVDPSKDFIQTSNASAAVKGFVKNACYDCHSNEVKYPWYTNIFPVSRWIGGHIKNGKKKLNFSVWAEYDKNKKIHKLEECIEAVETNWMPLKSYVFMHPEAKMTDNEKKQLIAWFKRESERL